MLFILEFSIDRALKATTGSLTVLLRLLSVEVARRVAEIAQPAVIADDLKTSIDRKLTDYLTFGRRLSEPTSDARPTATS